MEYLPLRDAPVTSRAFDVALDRNHSQSDEYRFCVTLFCRREGHSFEIRAGADSLDEARGTCRVDMRRYPFAYGYEISTSAGRRVELCENFRPIQKSEN